MKKITFTLIVLLAMSFMAQAQNILPAGKQVWADSTGGVNWVEAQDEFDIFSPRTGAYPISVPPGWTTNNPDNGYLAFEGWSIWGDTLTSAIVRYKHSIDLTVGGPFAFTCEQLYNRDSTKLYIGFSLDSVNWHNYHINRIGQGDTMLFFNSFKIPAKFHSDKVWMQLVYEANIEFNGFCEANWIIDDMRIIQLPVVRAQPMNLDTIKNNIVRLCDGDSLVLTKKLLNPPEDNTYLPNTDWDGNGQLVDTLLVIKNTGVVRLNGQTELPGANNYSDGNIMNADGDSINIVEQTPFDERIFLVTVDTTTGKYLIVWRKTPDMGTEHYNIYQTTIAGRKFLGSVPYGDIPVFVDAASNPLIKSERYVITTIDKCGNEQLYAVAKASAHKPMKLTVENDGFSGKPYLTWNSYLGFNYDVFYIYRGSTPTGLTLYDSVNYEIAFFDYDYLDKNPLTGFNYYRVEVDRGEVLDFSKKSNSGPFSRSLSNLEDNRQQGTDISPFDKFSDQVKIYPNPMTQSSFVQLYNRGKYKLQVMDMSGKIVFSDTFSGQNYRLEKGQLNTGFYIVNIQGKQNYRVKLSIQ